MRRVVMLLLVLGTGLICRAQGDIPVGTWRSHFNYDQTFLVELAGEKIYCTANDGLFYFDSSDNSLNKLSKIDGLSDAGISAMNYSSDLEILAVGYENGNIDLIAENEIFNIKTVKNSGIDASKRINRITSNDGLFYLMTDFGVIVLEPETGEIPESYQNLGAQGEVVAIEDVAFGQESIFLATSIGVLKGSLATNINLQDFNNWERFEGSFVEGTSFVTISSLGGSILASDGSDVYTFDGTSWSLVNLTNSISDITRMKTFGNSALIISNEKIVQLDASLVDNEVALPAEDAANDALLTASSELWYADDSRGLSRLQGATAERFVPNGIFPGQVSRLQLVDDKIVALPSSISSSYSSLQNGLGYAQFVEGVWEIIDPSDLHGMEDITGISSDNLFVSSFASGVLDVANQVIYDESNSPLAEYESTGQVLVSDIDLDESGNLWVANAGESPLLKYGTDGIWTPYSFGIGATEEPIDLKINNANQVWMTLNPFSNGGILAFDMETEESRYITLNNGGLPSTKVTDLEFSKDEEVWIATQKGLAFFPFTRGIIENNSFEVSQPVFGNRFLFEDEPISAIEIDGGNRKWIGTNDGLWLFEDNADELVTNFTTDNSPLPSNTILDLKIHPVSGELFIATDKGLISFRSDASEGTPFHSDVKIFPNPVTPGYTGQVGISGLASDVVVKITSVSGRLVKELRAAGGSTAWSVSDYNGVRVESGVYLVFSSSADGKETFVGKIAVIN